MREKSVAEQRYEAVRAVIADGETVTDVAARFGVARKTVHAWLARYEAGGLEGLGDRWHRSRSCPHQMPAAVEVVLAELRLAHPGWGPRRLAFELAGLDVLAGVGQGLVGPAVRDLGVQGVADVQLRLDFARVRGCLGLRRGADDCRRCPSHLPGLPLSMTLARVSRGELRPAATCTARQKNSLRTDSGV